MGAMPFNPGSRRVRGNRDRKNRLEHVGYTFEEGTDGLVLLIRPTGQILKRYKSLGYALRGAEIDIRDLRIYVIDTKTSAHQKCYWNRVLERYDTWRAKLFGKYEV